MRAISTGMTTLLLALAAATAQAAEQARLLRFADIHADRIAFVHAGDIFVVAATGGTAQRLTSHIGLELFPKFSPDGREIAYSAEYQGNRQIYVIGVEGGTPRQLTFHNDVGPMPPRAGFDYQVLDWTRDGTHVLFRANRLPWSERMGRPYLVPAAGGMERPLAVPESGGGMFSPDGKKLVYTPIDREFRTWKRYRGGRAQDVWIFDLERNTAERITDFEGTDNQPTWVGDTIYFTSDREDGRLNLHAYDVATRRTRKVTHHQDFDVLWPSAGPDALVYECGGYLYRFDPANGRSEKVTVEITGDFLDRMPHFVSVASQITDLGISPAGKRALIGARGDVFTVPAKDGPVRNLTGTPGIRELDPIWSPDGRRVAYLSDRTGEYEIYVRPSDGSGEERRITTDGDVWRFAPVWSPDSKKLAYGDKKQQLRYLDVERGKPIDVDRGTYSDITTYRWSPDSRFLVYTKTADTQFSTVLIYSLEDGKVRPLSDGQTNDSEPVFDPQGRYLYFLSDRDFNLTFSAFEFNYLYTRARRVYVTTLRRGEPPLLKPKSDEEAAPESEPEAGKDKKEKKEKKEKDQESDKSDQNAAGDGESEDDEDADEAKPVKITIDYEGLADRVQALPDEAGNYRNLAATAKAVLYLSGADPEIELRMYSLEDDQTKTVLEGIDGYDVSADGKKVLYSHAEKIGIVDLAPDKEVGDGLLPLEGLEMKVDPRLEWKQVFVDSWRILRDWFYDPGMHGLDWQAMHDLYAPMVDHVAHRADLDYILGEIGGELSAGHVYVNWGDMPRPERVENGLLGAEIEAHDSGYVRIARIFPGENWHEDFRSPLTEPGVLVKEGDYILAVNGRSTREVRNFYQLLEKTAGRQVILLVNNRPNEQGARSAVVRPVAHDTKLRYLDWVRSRRERVEELSGGRIGYIHLPNTAVEGNRELQKYFYPQAHKDGLIFDVRYNGGGFIPDRMIEMLARTRLSFWVTRGTEPARTPGFAHAGPKVCLINGYSSSGGDAFPYYFRKLALGKLIGTRTWGGLIGISGNPGLIDGGSINVPTFRFMDTEGSWRVENVGVEPDIEVLDRPDLVAQGRDPTLEKAVEVLLDELQRNPPKKIAPPPPPRIPR